MEMLVRPFRWSKDRYLALVDSGIIADESGVELHDGQIIETMPEGELHQWMYLALQWVFGERDAHLRRLAAKPTVTFQGDYTFEPDLAFFRDDAALGRRLPAGQDVLFIVEVSVSSRARDLGMKKGIYAQAGIPDYWVVDGIKRGVWHFSRPVAGMFEDEKFYPSDAAIEVPVLGGSIDLKTIFPDEPAAT